jgi:uncharacterized protein YndB with AHSA1/START domain
MTETAQSTHMLRVERTYDAPAERVFDAWTSPEVMRRWFHAGDETWATPVAEVDLRVGGGYRVTMRHADGSESTGVGEYTEIDRPKRLAFTWDWEGQDSVATLVELEFTERNGATTVVLTHSGLASESSKDGHTAGWQEALANLARELEA